MNSLTPGKNMILNKQQRRMQVKKGFTIILTMFALALLGLQSVAYAAVTITKAEWRADRQRLDVRATEGNGSAKLTATYNGKTYAMVYKSEERRYELKLAPICYDKSVTVKSTTGASASKAVTVKEGSSAGYVCSATPCPDADGDGYTAKTCGGTDCNDANPAVHPGATETCGDGIDQNCDGADLACPEVDKDADGFTVTQGDCNDNNSSIYPGATEVPCDGVDQNCNGAADDTVNADGDPVSLCAGDCNDTNPAVYPGAAEVCGDGIDQNCDGTDEACGGSGPHAGLTYGDYPAACIACHATEANDMLGSTHYQWLGEAPDMVNGTAVLQGKLTNAINSYCVNIEGDWQLCGKCHAGRGLRPDDPAAGLENIDCLVCHNEEYAAARVRLPNGSMGVANPTDSMVRNIHLPTRANCLNCHAKAGGGDAVKRGDLSMATITNATPQFDVHMNTTGDNLACQSCHVFQNHRVIGKGSDLRATDDPARGSEIKCVTCHTGKDSATGHATAKVNAHVNRVACQTCHIPTYAKVATETHRDWRNHSNGTPADGVSGPGHPATTKAANLVPEYRWWNRLSDNYLLGDDASRTYDPVLGTYPTSRPLGSVQEGKLYPFKYKTAVQPKTVGDDRLIALDTLEYLGLSGDVVKSVASGLANMGYPVGTAYEWVTTDTYQLLNHGIEPAGNALQCASCHGTTARLDLKGELGFGLKGPASTVCSQCHGNKTSPGFTSVHDKHVTSKRYDCSWCHSFSRPERGLRMP